MQEQAARYGIRGTVQLPFAQAVARTREELAKEGFGVITEIDMQETLRRKLGVESRPYVILGACNPALAHRALTEESEIGLLLPCNFVVYSDEENRNTVISALDPEAVLQLSENAGIARVAREVREKIVRVVAAVTDR